MRVPISDEVQASTMMHVDFLLFARPMRLVGVACAPVAPTRASRALDDDPSILDARE